MESFFFESFDRDKFNIFDDRLHSTQKILISNFKFNKYFNKYNNVLETDHSRTLFI